VGVEIPATLQYLGGQDHATTLTREAVSIGTIEHLLSALGALGVDDVLVDVDGPEVPVLDGSAAPFVILLHEAGLRPLAVPRLYLKILEPVEIVKGGKSVRLVPADHFEVAYAIGFDHPLLRHQALSLRVTPRSFTEAIASARTFGFLREVEMLRQSGLALLAHPLLGRLEARKAGHSLHAAVAQRLLATPAAWELVPRPGIPALEAPTSAPLAEPGLRPAEA
jgi:UDP-3-O-[3-hydroxymyristoyl] N-acetylglucosamine deacetylase